MRSAADGRAVFSFNNEAAQDGSGTTAETPGFGLSSAGEILGAQ